MTDQLRYNAEQFLDIEELEYLICKRKFCSTADKKEIVTQKIPEVV